MNYQQKYLKYKQKYLNLQKLLKMKTLIGGNPFRTIGNRGSVTENGVNMSNQCMWISIRDYINNFTNRGPITVSEIKRIAGLDLKSTANSDFNFENEKLRAGLERVCRHFNIQLNIYNVERSGQLRRAWYINYYSGRDKFPHPIRFNEDGGNIVSIAAYGAHFELIVNGYGILGPGDFQYDPIRRSEVMADIQRRHNEAVVRRQGGPGRREGPRRQELGQQYKPKLFDPRTKEYKTIEQIKDHTIIIDGITKIDTDAFLLQMKEVKNILKAILDEDFNQLTQTVRNQNSINLSNEELNQIISTNPDIINLLSSVNDMIKTRSELNDDNKRKIIELKGIYGTACPFVDEDLQKIINMCELDIKQKEEEIKNNTLILDGIKQLRENLQSILSSSSRPQSKIHEIISLVNTIFNKYLKKD